MSRRFWTIFRLDLASHVGRVSYGVLVALMIMLIRLATWSPEHAPGGRDGVWINSEIVVMFHLAFFYIHFPTFFLSLAAGRAVSRDEEHGTGPLLHATRLTPGEYIWAKFAAVMAAHFGVMVIACAVFAVLCGHLRPSGAAEHFGPFLVRAYLGPMLLVILPLQTFVAGIAFGVGTRLRNLLLVILLPIVLFLLCFQFLPTWQPDWMSPELSRALAWIEPTGLRWLMNLPMDWGAAFYNQSHIHFDLPFLLSRASLAGIGLGFVAWSLRAFRREVRGSDAGAKPSLNPAASGGSAFDARLLRTPLRRPRALEALGTVFRQELAHLAVQPGVLLFGILALVDTFMRIKSASDGMTGISLLLTAGSLAMRAGRNLSILVCLLLLFAIGESLDRDRVARLDPLVASSPTPSLALRGGKVLACLAAAALVLAADFLLGMGFLVAQGQVSLNPGPFLAVWVLVLTPTFLVWAAFVWVLQEITRNRITTYGLGIGALVATGLCIYAGHMTWAGNWLLFDNLVWSDLSPLEMDRTALVLNRLMVVALAGFLGVLAWAIHARRERDGAGTLGRIQGLHRNRWVLALLALGAVPALPCGILAYRVATGPDSKAEEARHHTYWLRNVAVWKDAPLPEARALVLELAMDPASRSIQGEGSWLVRNTLGRPLAQVPLTVPYTYDEVQWTLDGAPCPYENRAGLHVLHARMEPGRECRIGFRFKGRIFPGSTRNGGRWSFFLLPSGGILRHKLLVPTLGFQEDMGVTEATHAEPPGLRVRGPEPRSPVNFTMGLFTTRIRITGPAGFDYLSVGTRTGDRLEGGRRTVEWTSDGPVGGFGIQVGRWDIYRGRDVEVYFHPAHGGNVPSLAEALEAARDRYSQWYGPTPYLQFRLAEFPGLDTFATSMPGLIPFSENFGFLCRRDGAFDQTFGVAAHEAAHQWWGNLVAPCDAPGSRTLSEGLANFSAALLFEEVKGPEQRKAFMRLTESIFTKTWSADQDRPLVEDRLSGPGGMAGGASRAYNKGAWAFWMLMDHLGREPFMAGLRDFMARFRDNPDHPDIQDLLGALRARTKDPAGFDGFVDQWFREVQLPCYLVPSARRMKLPDGSWQVDFAVENKGGTRMPVTVAVASGRGASTRSVLAVVDLGPGERQTHTVACPFRPDRVEVDPDVRILQLRRKEAVRAF